MSILIFSMTCFCFGILKALLNKRVINFLHKMNIQTEKQSKMKWFCFSFKYICINRKQYVNERVLVPSSISLTNAVVSQLVYRKSNFTAFSDYMYFIYELEFNHYISFYRYVNPVAASVILICCLPNIAKLHTCYVHKNKI